MRQARSLSANDVSINTDEIAHNEFTFGNGHSMRLVGASYHDAVGHEINHLKRASRGTECRGCQLLLEKQCKLDNEVQELTAALFTEAGRMVSRAEEGRLKAERLLAESQLKLELLVVETSALKLAVKAVSPNVRLSKSSFQRLLQSPTAVPKISPPNENDLSPKKSPTKRGLFSSFHTPKSAIKTQNQSQSQYEGRERDPSLYKEIYEWRNQAGYSLTVNSALCSRLLAEDIGPCLSFDGKVTSSNLLEAIKQNSLELEPLTTGRGSTPGCSLLGEQLISTHRLRTSENDEWASVSTLARNRIVAVCDLFTYASYLRSGMMKPTLNDLYWEVVELRKNMALARVLIKGTRLPPFTAEPDKIKRMKDRC